MLGGGAGTMTLDELHIFEKHLEIWIYNIRSAKVLNVYLLKINSSMFTLYSSANKYL